MFYNIDLLVFYGIIAMVSSDPDLFYTSKPDLIVLVKWNGSISDSSEVLLVFLFFPNKILF